MPRPKTRLEDKPRFSIKDRVVWKSGKKWYSGEVLAAGRDKDVLQTSIPPGYKMQYARAKESKENKAYKKPASKTFTYLVAADSPLFKPGFTIHSIPEHHLQKESDSWSYKYQLINDKEFEYEELKELVLAVAKSIHQSKRAVPESISQVYESLMPELNKRKEK